jgi:hypothetical protein
VTRSRPLALAAALALCGLACTGAEGTDPGVRLRQPAAVAVFRGLTVHAPSAIRPYLVVANAARNDLSVIDAVTNEAVASPIKLNTLVLPVGDRPSLLAAASLGDGGADLLVAASAGDTVVQLVETWNVANVVHSDPGEASAARAVDLGHDVLALAAVPPDPLSPGRARIAAALADRRVAVIEYVRGADLQSIELFSSTVSAELSFHPEAIAVMPDDPEVLGLQTAIYVATRDQLGAPTAEAPRGVFGVAEIPIDDLSAPRALGARGPTRLIAAARLRERLPASAASDRSAFGFNVLDPPPDPLPDPQPLVPRVYAVLHESGCGPTRRIDCGVVAIDPTDPTPDEAIPPDYAGLMPYRAPMRIPGRPDALVVAAPPELSPQVAGEPDYSPAPVPGDVFTQAFMRIYMGTLGRATTAVAAVANGTGFVHFLDLGRFETMTAAPLVGQRSTGSPSADHESPYFPPETPVADRPVARRLWIQKADGTFATLTAELREAVTTTPGFTSDERWRLTWQGLLPNLADRAGEVGRDPSSAGLWLALQAGDGPVGARTLSQVVRLWHPALGVRAGDILVVKVGGMPAGCEGTAPVPPPGAEPPDEVENEFEVRVASLLPPSDDFPGGAVLIERPVAPDPAEWSACYDALDAGVTAAGLVAGLRVSVRAEGLVLLGDTVGYAGRPELGDPPATDPVLPAVVRPFALSYPAPPEDEDTLGGACPLADWDGTYPLAPGTDPGVLDCGGTCDRAVCERLVLARKARRFVNVSVDCGTDPADQQACAVGTPDPDGDGPQQATPPRWDPDDYPFPVVNGPVLGFQVAIQPASGERADPVRDLVLELEPSSGILPLVANASGVSPYQASGGVAFDRTPWTEDASVGYRFYLSYPANFVLDTTPSSTPVPALVIR